MFKTASTKFKLYSNPKGETVHSVNVELPTDLYELMEMVADRAGMTLSDLARQIVDHGKETLPFHTSKDAVRNLTFWLPEEQYKGLRKHAKKQNAFFKSMLLYWFIVCLKDVEHGLQSTRRRENTNQSVGR